MKCKKDTKKPEEQYFCYNLTSFTNHRASRNVQTSKVPFLQNILMQQY